jgi:flagellar motor switch protein FliM
VPPSTTTPRPARPGARARRRADVEPTVYDFRRPIQLSREHARILQVGLSSFARQATTVFTSALRTVCSVQLLSVTQEPYADYVDSLTAPTYLVKFSGDPLPGLGVLELSLPATMACVDHMLGGPGSPVQPVRPLTDIEGSVVSGVVERLLHELEYSLAGIVPLETALVAIEYSPQFAQVAGAADVVVVAAFEMRLGERTHRITLCLPFGGLQPYLAKAAAPAPVSERERTQRARAAELVNQQFEHVPVDVAIRVRPTRLGPQELGDLAVGDVLRLSHPASAPLDVTIDGTTFAHATLGTRGARLAALIVGSPKENS